MHTTVRSNPSRYTRAVAYRLTRWAGAKPDVTPTPEFPAEVPLVPEIPPEGSPAARGATGSPTGT